MHALLFLFAILFLSSCQTLHFYSQGVQGQMEILQKTRPNSQLLSTSETPKELKEKLILAESLCTFASEELALPGHSAYHKYADLGRRHVVFVLHAAPEFSLEPKTWFYPFLGQLDYRGYFHEDDAINYAKQLKDQGYEVHLGGTNAYSTLGLFHDPLLNTFIDYPEIDLAETIFHELTHRKIFKNGDTTFNESLANMVQEEGVRRYLQAKGRTAELADYEQRLIRRRDFYAEIEVTRSQLQALYQSGRSETEMRQEKRIILDKLKLRAQALQKRWGGKLLEEWLSQDLTNAHLLALITYNSDMQKFREILDQANGDFAQFFQSLHQKLYGSSPSSQFLSPQRPQ